MKILNLGSLNIDKVYSVEHFVSAGETISSSKMETFSGGKGLNQSIALARAGAEVYHAGAIGADGEGLRALLEAVSPMAVTGRGYALVRRADGSLVTDSAQAQPGERFVDLIVFFIHVGVVIKFQRGRRRAFRRTGGHTLYIADRR